MRRLVIGIAAGCLLAACSGVASPRAGDEAPWKTSNGEVITAAPDAGGVLSVRNCPTLTEATTAMPAIIGGPDVNAVPFKSMVLQCSYTLPGSDAQGNSAGISILVFDAEYEGQGAWVWDLASELGSPEPVSDLGDTAFISMHGGEREVWVNAGRFGVHLLGPAELGLAEVIDLARVAVAGLARPAR